MAFRHLDWYRATEWGKQTGKVQRVTFVCSGNTCRSPTAEYYFHEMTHWWDHVTAVSRGIKEEAAGQPIAAESRAVIGNRLAKFLERHKSKLITPWEMKHSDLVLTMDRKVRDHLKKEFPHVAHKIFTLPDFVERTRNEEVPNPSLPPDERGKRGSRAYHDYIQTYHRMVVRSEELVRKLVEILYFWNHHA